MNYKPNHHIRIVTATSIYDGHDAAINIMRRIMQKMGVEVIHLGHNRSALEIVSCAIQEDAHAVAVTSYQGGHIEFFKYMKDILRAKGAEHIRIFGGGGGTILPGEARKLEQYGIEKIYSPEDGRIMGLEGMVQDLVGRCDFDILDTPLNRSHEGAMLARLITMAENAPEQFDKTIKSFYIGSPNRIPVMGITGTGGAGKSSIIDETVMRILKDFPESRIAILSVDPSKRRTGGALLGDRLRMNFIHNPRVFTRSMATRQSHLALSRHIDEAIKALKYHEFDLIILESAGIGQSGSEILDHSDMTVYVMTPEYGAATQLEKIDMLDFADIIAINKFDKTGAEDARREVIKQYRRNCPY